MSAARLGWDTGFAQRCHEHLLAITSRDRLAISEEQRAKDVRDAIALVAELDRQLEQRAAKGASLSEQLHASIGEQVRAASKP